MERSIEPSPATTQTMLATTAEKAVLDDDQIYRHELDEVRTELAGLHAERSRRLVEGSTSAENIRRSSEEVAEYIQGLATDRYLRLTEQEGVSHEDAVVQIDAFIAEQTHLLLSDMTDKRTEHVAAHNRFVPKKITRLYNKALEVWRSWEVPAGDGLLVSRLRETGTWQHLEKKSEGSSRRAKIGRFALLAVKSSINGVEKLKYSGTRKRLLAMATLGAVSGAAAGAFLGAVGAGAAGVVAGSMAARATVRSGVSMKLTHDTNIENIALYDQVRMSGRIDQITDEAYSVEDILAYVEDESKTMLQQNNLKLLGSMAIGVVGGLLGNSAARGMGWLAGQYIDSQFNTPAYADTRDVIRPDHIISNSSVPYNVLDGVDVRANHVIEGVNHPQYVIDGSGNEAILPNHVVDGEIDKISTIPSHVIDGGAKRSVSNHVIDGSGSQSSEHLKLDRPFTVEGGHGYVHELMDAAKANHIKLTSSQAWEIHKELVDKVGTDYINLIHHKGLDTYSMGNSDYETGIAAPGKAEWDPRAVDILQDKFTKLVDTSHQVGNANHNTVADIADGRDEMTITRGEGGLEFADRIGIHDTDDQYAVWEQAAPKIEHSSLHDLTYFDKAHNEWRLDYNDGHMPIDAIRQMAQTAHDLGIDTDYDSAFTSHSGGNVASEIIDGTGDNSAGTTDTAHSFTLNEFGRNYSGDNTKAYYDALAGVDPAHRIALLNEVAQQLQTFKTPSGEALTYRAAGGVWHFREVKSLPDGAIKILNNVATKHHWSLAA